tara:strand:+ start:1639 stop:2232 length:594 start_codon:yes stop_codon:yes gene_type:complete
MSKKVFKLSEKLRGVRIKYFTVVILLYTGISASAQLFQSTSSKITFLSDAPLEDIYAESNKSKSVFNISDNKIVVLMKPNTFIFKNPMMQEHFLEDYMESDKYPKATLSGILHGDFDVRKEGVYDVTVEGILNIHGIEKKRAIKGNIIVRDGKLSVAAKFAIQVADHGIKIPSMKIKSIAEVVEVSVAIDYKEVVSK